MRMIIPCAGTGVWLQLTSVKCRNFILIDVLSLSDFLRVIEAEAKVYFNSFLSFYRNRKKPAIAGTGNTDYFEITYYL